MSVVNLHNRIATLCFQQYNSLPKAGKPNQKEWTILSCILLELEDGNKLEVVALGTGTKCIGSDKMSAKGDILHDSHAEVICRRAFLRYIYEKLLLPKNELFTFNQETQKFKLQSDVKFHFFSTHVPCGDAAIFSKQNTEDFGDILTNSNSLKRKTSSSPSDSKKIKLEENSTDIFRTGAKCLPSDTKQDLHLEGAKYHITGVVRTKPGRGVPTLSVSCSDKLARWCHLGLQGALLGVLLDSPIYLSSFTISGGTPYDEEAMKRAFYKRLGDVSLESPFELHEVKLGQAASIFSCGKRENTTPCPSSIIWVKGENVDRNVEVAVNGRRQGVTKKQLETSGALKICRKELFKKFIQIIKTFEIKLENIDNLDQLTYRQAKLCSHNYQKSWSILKKNFKNWTKKNDELMNFYTL